MTPAELLRELSSVDVRIVAGADGPELDAAPGALTADLLAACRSHRWLLVWAVEGARTRYAWHACERCDQVQLVKEGRDPPRRCSLTHGCKGLMRPGVAMTPPTQPTKGTIDAA